MVSNAHWRAYGVPLPLVPAPLAAAVTRHPHLAATLPAGWVRVDIADAGSGIPQDVLDKIFADRKSTRLNSSH